MDIFFGVLVGIGAGLLIGAGGIGVGELLYRWDRRRGRA